MPNNPNTPVSEQGDKPVVTPFTVPIEAARSLNQWARGTTSNIVSVNRYSLLELIEFVEQSTRHREQETLSSEREACGDGLQQAASEAIELIDELNERVTSRKFYGINQVLHNKLCTIRATLARKAAALSASEGRDVGREAVLPNPGHMEWPTLREALWGRFKDDEREDDDLCVSRAEACALLAWANNFDRAAQPRRDEEERQFAIIREASAAMQPGDGEVVFYLRISPENTRLKTIAGKGVEPQAALSQAIEALKAEREDAANCPLHSPPAPEQPDMVGELVEASSSAEKWLRAISDWLLENDHDMTLPSGVLDTDPLDIADDIAAALTKYRSGDA